MLLSLQEKNCLLERLPEIELSYDNILHRKVHADVFVVIPKGKKALLWFTYWKNQNVCFTLTLNERGNICDVSNYPVCFEKELSLSTLLYGTLFENDGLTHFSCENIYYYKGFFTGNYNYLKKLALFRELFTYFIKQTAYTNKFLVVGLPVMKRDFQEALDYIKELPYQVYGIQMYYMYSRVYKNHMDKTNTSEGIYLIKQVQLPEAYFNVKATLQSDIYNLYCYDHTHKYDKPYGIAMISSYKSSVMMNSLFRTIKENANLDLLEESDNEDEFENTNESKFVDLDKSIIMKCVFLKKFRKWQPMECIKEKDRGKIKISTFKETLFLER